MRLEGFDVVFGLATPAIDLFTRLMQRFSGSAVVGGVFG